VGLVHQLLCAVVRIYLEEQGVLPVNILDDVAYFVKYVQAASTQKMLCTFSFLLSRTVQKIQTSLQIQQELGKIKRFIRQNEIGIRLRTYETELRAILEHLKVSRFNLKDLFVIDDNLPRYEPEAVWPLIWLNLSPMHNSDMKNFWSFLPLKMMGNRQNIQFR
jgi:hypothetical protein